MILLIYRIILGLLIDIVHQLLHLRAKHFVVGAGNTVYEELQFRTIKRHLSLNTSLTSLPTPSTSPSAGSRSPVVRRKARAYPSSPHAPRVRRGVRRHAH